MQSYEFFCVKQNRGVIYENFAQLLSIVNALCANGLLPPDGSKG